MAHNGSSSKILTWLAMAAFALLTACASNNDGKEVLQKSLAKQQMYYTVEAETEVIVHNKTSNQNLLALLGDREIVIPVVARLKAGIDLSLIKKEDVSYEGHTVRFVLPDPVIVMESVEIDWDNVDENVGLLRKGFTDEEIAEIAAVGSKSIRMTVPKTEIVEMAQNRAKLVLETIAKTAGYKAIVISPKYSFNETIGFVRNANEHKKDKERVTWH
ncbi:MAG: DUF4230 domain-containing protein [Bacteroidales bacterium]|nr:DUF4230 domain-containing protein [Bacteroidales bacterium]